MNGEHILQEIRDNLEAVIAQDSALGTSLFKRLLRVHPADIGRFVTDLEREDMRKLFGILPKPLKLAVFEEFSDHTKVAALSFMDEPDRIDALNILTADELTDLFDLFSDEELKKYLELIHKKAREDVISLLQFHPESAGGIMDTHVLTLMDDFTVEKATKILQRLRPRRDIHQHLYVTDRWHRLVGYIQLEDLLLHDPKVRIAEFMHKNELIAQASQDQEKVARKMVHYGLMMVPVVGKDNYFLGAIPSETLVDVIVEEAEEDVQKMSALAPMKHSYFETSFWRLLFERSYILVILLLIESFSGAILHSYEGALTAVLISFIPMLISVGGNTSNQTSTLAIQGMASGDINRDNMTKFLRREFFMAVMIASVLGAAAFGRVYLTSGHLIQSLAVSFSLSMIVLVSVALGSFIPLVLKRLRIDPAFSAGPFLATVMDILGIFIFCLVSKLILS